MNFVVYKVNGDIIRIGSCPAEALALQADPLQEEYVIEGDGDFYTDYVDDFQIYTRTVPKEPEPVPISVQRSHPYPHLMIFIDAHVKLLSSDPVLQAEGQTQLDNYVQACLQVKKDYPKS